MHANLLARQSRIQDQIKLEEAQKYASQLYEEEEPEPDIYTEGWESDRVNPYKNANVPQTKVIDVRGFHMPIKGNFITSPYGYRPAFRRTHKGVDMRSAVGDTVYAAFTGKVRLTKFERGGYGFYVILRHDNGLETVYGHLTRFLVQPNQYVKAGQPIALSGNTGRSTGPHLHFETRFMGYAINPAAIIDFANRTTHTDSYTFNKNNYTESRSYTPSRKYAAVRSTSSSSNNNSTASKSNHKYDNKTKKRSAERSTYKVRKGDSLGKIAACNGTTVAQLKKLNGIKGDKVQSGKVLRVK
ncbi:MAG: peptidoglycan DD-metalloendopeptidase family protein [Muribaculaceae bacterium]|nr:peptidoglycan DD-metalloendopeptidase family protein [Muribaculaceae bacterium]